LVLRFFALRHVDHYARGMQGFLDTYQRKAVRFTEGDIDKLRKLYLDTFRLAQSIYGNLLFRVFDPESGEWQSSPHKAFQDAVLIGLSGHLNKTDSLLANREKVLAATKQLFLTNPPGTFTGRGNTKQDIKDRVELFAQMISSVDL